MAKYDALPDDVEQQEMAPLTERTLLLSPYGSSLHSELSTSTCIPSSPSHAIKSPSRRRKRLISRETKRRVRRKVRRWVAITNHWLWGHAAFLLGTLCATLAAVQDLKEAVGSVDDDFYDDDDDTSASLDPLLVWNTAKVFSVASTLFYMVSSLPTHGHSSCGGKEEEEHTAEETHQIHFPLLFGLGALFDFGSSLFEDEDSPWLGFGCEVLSVHFFLLCALWTISKKCTAPSNQANKYILLGDFLFLLGAMIDVATSYGDHPTVSDEEGKREWICNASLGLASSLTWMVDSILYLMADLMEEEEDDDDDVPSTDEEDTASCSLDANTCSTEEDSVALSIS